MKIDLTENRDKVYRWLISSVLITFLSGIMLLTNISIAALILYWFTEKSLILKIKEVLKSKEFWAISILFWMTLIGILYTDSINLTTGWKYVERRLALIIFPLILGTINLSKKSDNTFSNIGIGGIVVIGVIGFVNSYLNYNSSGDTAYFYNNNLLEIFKHQAVYFGLFINIILLIISRDINSDQSKQNAALLALFLVFCLLFQYFLASRVSLIISLFIILYNAFLSLRKFKVWYLASVLGAAVISGIILLTLYSSSTIDRFKSLGNIEYDISSTQEEYNLNDNGEPSNWNGLTLRMAIWKCAYQLISENTSFGVGTGDYDSELEYYYSLNNFKYGIIHHYGTHNQYLYVGVVFGIIGLILYLSSLTYLIRFFYIKNNYIYLFCVVILMLSFLTENVLNRFFGIFLFSFYMSLGAKDIHHRSDPQL